MRKWLVLTVLALFLAGCASSPAPKQPSKPQQPAPQQQAPQSSTPAPKPAPKQWSAPPAMQIDPEKQYTATLKTSMGDIQIELFAKDAPLTVNNFVFLSQANFYDGVVFHRIIKDFMIQTGDPLGNGTGGPGYRFKDELPVKRAYEPGIVAMANSGPNTNGSQFFICSGVQCTGLDNIPNYTQFGRVVQGMDVVKRLASVPVTAGARGEMSKPVTPPAIVDVTIAVK